MIVGLNEVCSLTKQRAAGKERDATANRVPQRSLLLDEAEG